MLAAGLPLRCIAMQAPGGYDTHSDELATLPDNLDLVAKSLLAFQRDLEARGLADRVLTHVWSEFGRRPEENGSGTDHGAAGLSFLIGSRVRGTMLGEFPGLATLDDNDNLRETFDFRRLYSGVARAVVRRRCGADHPGGRPLGPAGPAALGPDDERSEQQHDRVQALVDRDRERRMLFRRRVLDLAHPPVDDRPVVLGEVGDEDAGREQRCPAGADLDPDPDEGGEEGERVEDRVLGQRAAVLARPAQAAVLVHRLPVRLEQEVAGQVTGDEYQENLGPGHMPTLRTPERDRPRW